MNYNYIIKHLCSNGYVASLNIDATCLHVSFKVNDKNIELIHFCEKELTGLPNFFLRNPPLYGQLAHVVTSESGKLNLGGICVGDQDSLSINFEQPQLALEESLKRHIALLTRVITDEEWNKNELLREFQANWLEICTKDSHYEIICSSQAGSLEEIAVYLPVRNSKFGFDSLHLGMPEKVEDLSTYSYIRISDDIKKREKSKGKGFIIPLSSLSPAPSRKNKLKEWYIDAIQNLEKRDESLFLSKYISQKSRQFWLVFNAKTPSGVAWFCLYFQSKKKRTLPIKLDPLKYWKVEAINIQLFNKEFVMPRSGAKPSFSDKKVLLVGCGSVGGEIAHKIAASGVGHLSLADNDIFSMSNLYRHVLSREWIGFPKTAALSFEIGYKYPWCFVKEENIKLLDVRDQKILEFFDLIIIAIGSPTHERLFHRYLIDNHIKVPVINTWLEGYGIGGHAILDIPLSKGCFSCAYVDFNTLGRGLASNLNFLEVNQNVTKNHAGCRANAPNLS